MRFTRKVERGKGFWERGLGAPWPISAELRKCSVFFFSIF